MNDLLNPRTPEQLAADALLHREMYRKSRDVIRVYNPLNQAFRFKYDSFWHTIPAKQTKDMERFLANHYFQAIAQHMIGQMIVEKGEKLLAQRDAKGLPPLMDNYDINKQIWDYTPKMDDANILEQISSEVILGLVEEFGMEDAIRETAKAEPVDTRTAYEKVMDKMNKRISHDITSPISFGQEETKKVEAIKIPVNKKALEKEVTQ